jgi:hypothetical protein
MGKKTIFGSVLLEAHNQSGLIKYNGMMTLKLLG